MAFQDTFGSNAFEGETITCEVDGFTLTATIYADDDTEAPWDRSEGHGPVSEWTSRDKLPGERVLNVDRPHKRFYDFAGAVALARKDGWDTEPYGTGTVGERAARAAEADYDRLRRWCNGQWCYVGVAVTVSRAGVDLTGPYDHTLWGIESDAGDYLREVANEYVEEALEAARAKVAELVP